MADTDESMGGEGLRSPSSVATIIGLTGGIGAGKSTALAMFAELGARVFSADEAVHRLYRRDDLRDALRRRFGSVVVDRDGAVDREALAGIVTADDAAMGWLEALVHPRVGEELRRMLVDAPGDAVVVCEVPLLFETGMEGAFDLVVSIEAPSAVRRTRNAGRTEADVWQALERRQLASDARQERADMVFVNDGDEQALRVFVAEAFERARSLGAERAAVARETGAA